MVDNSKPLEKLKEYQRTVADTFTTPSGVRTLALLRQYYDQNFRPDMQPHELAFHCGQRDVVGFILECIENGKKTNV